MRAHLTIDDPARYQQTMALPASLKKARQSWEEMRAAFASGITSRQLPWLIDSSEMMARAMASEPEALKALHWFRARLREYVCKHHLSGQPVTADERAFSNEARRCYDVTHQKFHRFLDTCTIWERVPASIFQSAPEQDAPPAASSPGKYWTRYWHGTWHDDEHHTDRADAATMLMNIAFQYDRQDLVDLFSRLAGKKPTEQPLYVFLASKLDEIEAWVASEERARAEWSSRAAKTAAQTAVNPGSASRPKHRRRRRSGSHNGASHHRQTRS